MTRWRGWPPASATKAATGPIGLDFGPDALHLVQLERDGDDARLHAACSVAYPVGREELRQLSPRELRGLISDALKKGGFRGRRVVMTAPRSRVKLRVFNYEVPESGSEDEVILGLVSERMGVTDDESVVDYVPMRTTGDQRGEKSALVAVARREDIVEDLELLAAGGLEAVAVEVVPVAIQRLVAWSARDDIKQNSLVIHCGAERSDLVVLWGRRLILYREIEFGEQPLVETLSRVLDVSVEEASSMLREYGLPTDTGEKPESEALAGPTDEIQRTLLEILRPSFAALAEQVDRALVYTASRSHGAVVELVLLSGRLAGWPGTDRLLEGLLSIPVSVLDARQTLLGSGTEAPRCGVGIALAAGCALRRDGGHG